MRSGSFMSNLLHRKAFLFLKKKMKKKISKKIEIENCKLISTLVDCEAKLYKHGDGDKTNPTFFKNLVGSLRYLTCTRSNIHLVSDL